MRCVRSFDRGAAEPQLADPLGVERQGIPALKLHRRRMLSARVFRSK